MVGYSLGDDDDDDNNDGLTSSLPHAVPDNPMAFVDPPFSSVLPMVIPLINNEYYLSAIECMRQDEPKDITFPDLGADRIAFTASCVRHWIHKLLEPTYGAQWPHGVSGYWID